MYQHMQTYIGNNNNVSNIKPYRTRAEYARKRCVAELLSSYRHIVRIVTGVFVSEGFAMGDLRSQVRSLSNSLQNVMETLAYRDASLARPFGLVMARTNVADPEARMDEAEE